MTAADSNPETAPDTAWLPLATTPGHPEYPVTGCVSTGWAEAVRHYFGTSHVNVTLTSTVANTVPHVFKDTNEMVDDVIVARIAGGALLELDARRRRALNRRRTGSAR